jgi:hypothetical protein
MHRPNRRATTVWFTTLVHSRRQKPRYLKLNMRCRQYHICTHHLTQALTPHPSFGIPSQAISWIRPLLSRHDSVPNKASSVHPIAVVGSGRSGRSWYEHLRREGAHVHACGAVSIMRLCSVLLWSAEGEFGGGKVCDVKSGQKFPHHYRMMVKYGACYRQRMHKWTRLVVNIVHSSYLMVTITCLVSSIRAQPIGSRRIHAFCTADKI